MTDTEQRSVVPAAGTAGRGQLLGRISLTLIALSLASILITGLAGSSVAQPPLGASEPGFPYLLLGFVPDGPSAWLVTGLLLAGLLLGAAALGFGWRALPAGWTPQPRRLLLAGTLAVAALILVPPMGSADHLSYAAYGRIVVQGGDPYLESPQTWRDGDDPVVSAVERPWRWAPSVYGPLATWEQSLASRLGGTSLPATVFVLSALNALAFLATGLFLHRMARGPNGQARAALLWTLNPLLLYELVVGAHVDTLAVALGVAALAALARFPLAAGLLVGAAVAVKAPMALWAVAAIWALRRSPGAVLRLILGTVIVLIPAYLLAGPHAFDQLRRASRYVSLTTPWHLVIDNIDRWLGKPESRELVAALALLVTIGLVVVLARVVPASPSDSVTLTAARVALVLGGAWLFAAPYALPWYDAMAWAPLALMTAGWFDAVWIARTTALAVAYVPGRAPELLPGNLRDGLLVLRGVWVPGLLLALLGLLLVLLRRGSVPGARPGE